MKCIICGSENIETVDTVISDFVMDRITDDFIPDCGMNRPVKLCFCRDCTFAFYDHRITDEECDRLYDKYRGPEYQKTREKHECWYTEKVNRALNEDELGLREQKRVINEIVKKNVDHELRVSLDYGGNEGRTYFKRIGTKERYVFDISGIPTIKGVKGISDFDELRKHEYDFIMCNHLFEHLAEPVEMLERIGSLGNKDTIFYIEVPSENPFTGRNKFSLTKNLRMLADPLFNNIRLATYYLKKRRSPFMPMNEHINFYTVRSMRKLVESSGFEVIDIEENIERTCLGEQTVLSVLFRRK